MNTCICVAIYLEARSLLLGNGSVVLEATEEYVLNHW